MELFLICEVSRSLILVHKPHYWFKLFFSDLFYELGFNYMGFPPLASGTHSTKESHS